MAYCPMSITTSTYKQHLLIINLIILVLLPIHWDKLTTPHLRWDKYHRNQKVNLDSQWEFHVDINDATRLELSLLDNIGPALAARIVNTRQQYPDQRFTSVEQLLTVKGIGPKTLEKIRHHLICQ